MQRYAHTANMTLCAGAMSRAADRAAATPGLVVFYGPAGYGKTSAAMATAARFDAIYIRATAAWTRKSMLEAIVAEINPGTPPARTTSDLLQQIIRLIGDCDPIQPLIVDEFDYVVKVGLLDLLRDIHDVSGVPMLLLGEEAMPEKLRQWERFHRRVQDFVAAQPSDCDDARKLAQVYAADIRIDDDLLGYFVDATRGNAGYLTANLSALRASALNTRTARVDRSWWGERSVFVGNTPKRALPGAGRAAASAPLALVQ